MNTLSVIACLAVGSIAGCAPVQVVDAPVARIEAPAPRTGARWTYDVIDPYRREIVGSFSQDATGGAQRQEFDALRIVHTMNLGDGVGSWTNTIRTETLWYAPAINGWVRLERRDSQRERVGMNPRTNDDRRIWELREHHTG